MEEDKTTGEVSPEKANDSSAFWDEEKSQTTDEPLKQESGEEQDEPLDNRERSRLGRRFSQLEEEFRQTRESLGRMEEMLSTREIPQYQTQNSFDDDLSDPDHILTVGELEKLTQKKQEKERIQRQKYADLYIGTVKRQYNMSPELYAEIEKELLTNVSEYPTHSNWKDPANDAKINFKLARANVIEKKYSNEVKANVRGGVNSPTGVTATTRTNGVVKPSVKLDEFASKFQNAMGLDDDFVQKSISRNDM